MKIAVLGSGGWGTALAMLLEENGHQVTLWSFLEEESRRLRETGDRCPVVVLSGPSHAEEVARKVPTAVVSASPSRAAA